MIELIGIACVLTSHVKTASSSSSSSSSSASPSPSSESSTSGELLLEHCVTSGEG